MAIVKNATFETDVDELIIWFSCTVTRINTDSHGGSWSLETVQTADFAGVQLNNHPYYVITGGNTYDFSVWYKEGTATMPTVNWNLSWRQNDGNTVEGTNQIQLARATSWTNATGTFTAPAAAARLAYTFETTTGNGSAWRLDDILVQDAVTGAVVVQAAQAFPAF